MWADGQCPLRFLELTSGPLFRPYMGIGVGWQWARLSEFQNGVPSGLPALASWPRSAIPTRAAVIEVRNIRAKPRDGTLCPQSAGHESIFIGRFATRNRASRFAMRPR